METTTVTAVTSNVQLIRNAFDYFSKGNIAGILDLCADDVEWGTYKVPNVPFSGMFYGKEGVQQYFTELAKNLNFTTFEPRRFIAQEDMVIALGHTAGTVKSTGKSFENDWCFTNTIRNGKLTRWFAFVDSYDNYRAFQE